VLSASFWVNDRSAVIGDPHCPQNLKPGGFKLSQLEHGIAIIAPQFPQWREEFGLSKSQELQRMGLIAKGPSGCGRLDLEDGPLVLSVG
jgi:hypothetical protein